VVTITASSVLADGAVFTATTGLVTLARRLWPTRRKAAGPLAAGLTGLGALALAMTGRRLPCVMAGIMLAVVAAVWLTSMGGHAWSRLQANGWSALRSGWKAQAPASHLYFWVDGLSATVVSAFIVRQNLASFMGAAIGGLAVLIVRSATLRRTRRETAVAIWTETRRPTPRWPG
jgi:hypothetical protein